MTKALFLFNSQVSEFKLWPFLKKIGLKADLDNKLMIPLSTTTVLC